jgi:L-lactate dehydrogenase complex protein LldG
MTDSSRTEIIARIRRASQGNPEQEISASLKRIGIAPGETIAAERMPEIFLANVLRNGGGAGCAQNRSDAAKAVAQQLYHHHRTRKLVAGNDPRLAAMPWRDGGLLPRFGAAAEGDLASISYARVGVAQSGSVITWTGKANPASNNLLVENHVVLVDLEDLVADMEAAWQRIDASQNVHRRHRAINVISAPSSTADIEMQLVMGAHGPRSWHVILIGDVADSTLEQAQRLAGIS